MYRIIEEIFTKISKKKASSETSSDESGLLLIENSDNVESKTGWGINQPSIDLEAYSREGCLYVNNLPHKHLNSNDLIVTSPFEFIQRAMLTEKQVVLYLLYFLGIFVVTFIITYYINKRLKRLELGWYNLICLFLIIFGCLLNITASTGLYESFLNYLTYIEEVPESYKE